MEQFKQTECDLLEEAGRVATLVFVAQSVGFVVGAAMNVQNGVFLAPMSVSAFPPFLRILCQLRRDSGLSTITYLSYIRYDFEGTALTIYGYGREKLKCFQVYCHFKNPETTLEELDMLNADFTLDILAFLLIFVMLRVAAYLFLRWKIKITR